MLYGTESSVLPARLPPSGMVRLVVIWIALVKIRPLASGCSRRAILAVRFVRPASGQSEYHDDPDCTPDQEEDEQDNGHHGRGVAHRGRRPASGGVMSRRPTPISLRTPRAAASGG